MAEIAQLPQIGDMGAVDDSRKARRRSKVDSPPSVQLEHARKQIGFLLVVQAIEPNKKGFRHLLGPMGIGAHALEEGVALLERHVTDSPKEPKDLLEVKPIPHGLDRPAQMGERADNRKTFQYLYVGDRLESDLRDIDREILEIRRTDGSEERLVNGQIMGCRRLP